MSRKTELISSIVDMDNLRRAWLKTIRGKQDKPVVMSYREDLTRHLQDLSRQLSSGSKRWGPYTCFTIYDPKERTIKVAPLEDRIAYHAIMNICEPILERPLIYDSYACRKGRGQLAALSRAKQYSGREEFFLKLDIRKYFDSISHAILKQRLQKLFSDNVVLTNFFHLIDSYHHRAGKGIPIGSLTSQYFANLYLSPMDHFIQERLHCRCYVRYMDDFVLWGSSDFLKASLRSIESYLSRLELSLKLSMLNRCIKGIPFLGYRVYSNQLRLSHRSRYRFRRKVRQNIQQYQSGHLTCSDFMIKMETLFAFVKNAESYAFRMRVLRENGICP